MPSVLGELVVSAARGSKTRTRREGPDSGGGITKAGDSLPLSPSPRFAMRFWVPTSANKDLTAWSTRATDPCSSCSTTTSTLPCGRGGGTSSQSRQNPDPDSDANALFASPAGVLFSAGPPTCRPDGRPLRVGGGLFAASSTRALRAATLSVLVSIVTIS